MEINQYDITMATHYDITMGNNIVRDIHCNVTMSDDIAMNFFYYVFSALCLLCYFIMVSIE